MPLAQEDEDEGDLQHAVELSVQLFVISTPLEQEDLHEEASQAPAVGIGTQQV